MKRSIIFLLANYSLGILMAFAVTAVSSSVTHGQTMKMNWIASFNGDNGSCPTGGPTLSGSHLYGTASGGGANNGGILYSINTDGTGMQTLYSFNSGADPMAGLTLIGSTLYGTTAYGSSNGKGSIFSFDLAGGGFKNLHTFDGTDGRLPVGNRLTMSDSILYGTTVFGGTNDRATIFAINPDGSGFHTVFSFDNTNLGSARGDLTVLGSKIYGTTGYGGTNRLGSIFSVNTDGTEFQTLYSFSYASGACPTAGLTLCDSKFYGTTSASGPYGNYGTVFSVNLDGTGYQVLHAFNGLDGAYPYAGVTLVGSTLYGSTFSQGPQQGRGTIFSLNSDGSGFRNLYAFSEAIYGINDNIAVSGSALYGSTEGGGKNFRGTIFSLAIPEPSTVTLLFTAGLSGLLWWRRRANA